MQPWKKKTGMLRGTRFVTQLNPLEREVLGNCAATVADALMERVRTAPKDELAELTGMMSGHSEAPTDPGLARLLPSFFADGAESVEGDAALTRQLNETEIIKNKLMNLQLIGDHVGPSGSVNITLSQEEVQPWLAGINDLRIYYQAISQPLLFEVEETEEKKSAEELLSWLAFHQDTLLRALMGDLPEEMMEDPEGDNPGDSEGPQGPDSQGNRPTDGF